MQRQIENRLQHLRQTAAISRELVDRYVNAGELDEPDREILSEHLPVLVDALCSIFPKPSSIRKSRLAEISLSAMVTTPVILHTDDVARLTGYSRATIFAKLRKGDPRHDPSFPASTPMDGSKDLNFDSRDVFAWIEKQFEKKAGGQV